MRTYLKATLGGLIALTGMVSPLYVAAQQPNFGQFVGPGTASQWTCYTPGCDTAGIVTAVTAAALTGCSSGGTPIVAGNQLHMLVTAGTSASSTCTITWPTVRQYAPNCVVTPHTAAAVNGFITVENTTTLTWGFTSIGSSVWDVVCLGS